MLYIIIFIAFAVLLSLRPSKNTQKIVVFFFITFFAFLVGFRDRIGADFISYVEIYKLSPKLSLDNIFDWSTYENEFLFSFLGSLLKTLGFESPILYFIILSLLTSIFLQKAITRFRFNHILYAWFIYYCVFFLNFQFNTVKHGLMASIVWLAFSYIEEGNKMKFFKIIIIGSLFHLSCLVFLPFYWLLKININKKSITIITIVIAFSVVIPFIIPLLDTILLYLPSNVISKIINYYLHDYYLGVDSSNKSLFSFGLIIYTILVFIIYFRKKDLEKQIYSFNIFYNSLLISVTIGFVFASVGIFVERISGVLNLSLLFLIPIALKNLSRNKQLIGLYFIIVLTYGFLLLNTNMNKQDKYQVKQFLPYKTVI